MLCSDTRPSRERDGGIAMGGCRCRCMFRVPHYPVAQLQPTGTYSNITFNPGQP